jgi:hypothetical protein
MGGDSLTVWCSCENFNRKYLEIGMQEVNWEEDYLIEKWAVIKTMASEFCGQSIDLVLLLIG